MALSIAIAARGLMKSTLFPDEPFNVTKSKKMKAENRSARYWSIDI
jgi:hypothetical protein